MPRALIIRCDGSEEELNLPALNFWSEMEKKIDSRGLDHVNLRDGRMMWVDDIGLFRPEQKHNEKATQLYLSVCRFETETSIRGDVFITYEEDWNE